MFNLKLNGRLDNWLKDHDGWLAASQEEKADGCLFMRALLNCCFKGLVEIIGCMVMLVILWMLIWVASWMPIAIIMKLTGVPNAAERLNQMTYLMYVPHILVVGTTWAWMKTERWREYRRMQKRQDAKTAPWPFPKAPSKIKVLWQTITGRTCFKINVVE